MSAPLPSAMNGCRRCYILPGHPTFVLCAQFVRHSFAIRSPFVRASRMGTKVDNGKGEDKVIDLT